jgi:hypothetical protein
MPILTTNPAGRAASTHRAQIAVEAVISAYIHEITPSKRPNGRCRGRHSCTQSSPRAIDRSPLNARSRSRALAPRRRTALQLDRARSATGPAG